MIRICFDFRASDFELSRMILGSERHPRHAAEKPRRRQPNALGKSVFRHRLLRIDRAGGTESAAHDVLAPGLEEQPIAFDYNVIIKNHRGLPARRPHPIAHSGDRQHDRSDAEPDTTFLYGWPRWGVIVRACRRFFCHFGELSSCAGFRTRDRRSYLRQPRR